MLPRIKSSHYLLIAVVVLIPGILLPAQTPSSTPTPASKAESLKEQYNHASPNDKKVIGEELIDAQLAVAETQIAQKDFAGAQKILSQALLTSSAIKSDKSKNITAKLSSVSIRKTLATKVESLRETLIHKPGDLDATRQLVDLLVLEFDDFKNAQEAARGQEDARLKSALELAAKPPTDLSAQEASDLAAWYIDAAKRNTGTTKASAQAKAGTVLKALLERENLETALKAKAHTMFDALPQEAKIQSNEGGTAGQDTQTIGLSTSSIVQWLKNVPKDVS